MIVYLYETIKYIIMVIINRYFFYIGHLNKIIKFIKNIYWNIDKGQRYL